MSRAQRGAGSARTWEADGEHRADDDGAGISRGALMTPPLPPELQRVHMVGIGGAGMSGIARILLDRGAMVSGSDAKESRGVRALRARGALIRICRAVQPR
jgi:hypothetical protein